LGIFFLSIEVFAFPMIAMAYCFGFLFNNADTAYKYSLICIISFSYIPVQIAAIFGSETLLKFIAYCNPIVVEYSTLGAVFDPNPE